MATQADDTEYLVRHLHTDVSLALPPALAQRRIGLRDIACHGQQQGDGQLSRRHRVAARRVDHHDTGAGGGLDIDVVDASPGAADHLQPARVGQHGSGHLGGRAHHQGIVLPHRLFQLRRAHPGPYGHLEAIGNAEALDPPLRDGVCYQDSHARRLPAEHGIVQADSCIIRA